MINEFLFLQSKKKPEYVSKHIWKLYTPFAAVAGSSFKCSSSAVHLTYKKNTYKNM